MKVLGAHVRVANERYLAGFAVLEETSFSRHVSLPAPAEVDEGHQLQELYRTAVDLLDDVQPELLALRVSEAGRYRAQRAEGVILAAAASANVSTELWLGAGLLRPSGLARSSSFAERVAALCRQVSDERIRPREIEQAVAAARASVVTR
jgi:hypothetical protein